MTSDITVGQVAERVRMLDVKCARCDRHARLSMSRLLLELGPNAPIRPKLFLPAQPG